MVKQKLKKGDKIVVDLGGVEFAKGKIHKVDDTIYSGKKRVSFSAYSGWRHIEYCTRRQIKLVNPTPKQVKELNKKTEKVRKKRYGGLFVLK